MPSKFFPATRGVYKRPWCALPAPTICTSATKDIYTRHLTVSRATKIFLCQQPTTNRYVLHVLCLQPTTYIYVLIKYLDRCLVVRFIFLCLLSYIYKPLDIIEIMFNCNTNNQGRIYISISQGFSKILVSWDSYATKKSLHARGKPRI